MLHNIDLLRVEILLKIHLFLPKKDNSNKGMEHTPDSERLETGTWKKDDGKGRGKPIQIFPDEGISERMGEHWKKKSNKSHFYFLTLEIFSFP